MQPSVRDVHHPFPFPQPAFEIAKQEKAKSEPKPIRLLDIAGEMRDVPEFENHPSEVLSVSNPQHISLNDISISLLNADIFADMETSMCLKPKGTPNEEYIVQSMMEQRSLYPIFPSPSVDFPVEFKCSEAFSLQSIPDILLVPSSTPCFVKVFDLS